MYEGGFGERKKKPQIIGLGNIKKNLKKRKKK